MTDNEIGSEEGICFIADMDSWGWNNFGVSYATQFFEAMSGRYGNFEFD